MKSVEIPDSLYVSIPSIGSMAFLLAGLHTLKLQNCQLRLNPLNRVNGILMGLEQLCFDTFGIESQSPQSGQWHSY